MKGRAGKQPVFALIDCNNFFVSCERLFRPDLEGRPVVVLSSNDGCAVSRSNEAKALGIPMGAPAFKYRELFEKHGVMKFSANFELYGDISRRITDILRELTPRIEVYSVDESFLDVSQLHISDYAVWARAMRARILREVGVPVSLGIAHSKTLAKVATEVAKQDPSHGGAVSFVGTSQAAVDECLQQVAIKDVWGVGYRLAPRLRAEGVGTALHLKQLRPQLAQQLMGIHGRQMVEELNGRSCLPLERIGKPRKSVSRGRTFGEDTSQEHVLEAAIASMMAQAAFRVREENMLTSRIGLFMCTNRHKPGYRYWYKEQLLHNPTNDTGLLTALLVDMLKQVFSPQQQYHKLNVFLHDFIPVNGLQTDLFHADYPKLHDKSQLRMQALDSINTKFGRGKIRMAAEDLSKTWQPIKRLSSPRYVTHWDELPICKTHL